MKEEVNLEGLVFPEDEAGEKTKPKEAPGN